MIKLVRLPVFGEGYIVEDPDNSTNDFGLCSVAHQCQFKICQEEKIDNQILALNLL